MTKTQLIEYINTEAEYHPDYTIIDSQILPYPFKDLDTKEIRFSVAHIIKLENKTDDSKNHTALLAYDGNEFFFWCGDNFIDKTTSISLAAGSKMVAEAATKVKSNEGTATRLMNGLFHSYEKSSGCRFWASWKSKGTICRHVKHLLKVVDVENFIPVLEKEYDEYMDTSAKPTTSSSDDIAKMHRYAFKKHVLFTGRRGFGKTFGAYQYLDDQKIPSKNIFEVGGFEGLESIDLLGQNIPFVKEIKKEKKSVKLVANNSFSSEDSTEHIQDLVWMDGALTAAFRNASKGIKTVLLIDELLRIPSRELSILIASLTPDNKGFFTLRTRRILGLDKDGCGIEEVIKVKKENLWVVATTNIGSGYDVDDVDLALYDRFMIIHKAPVRSVIKTIIENEIKTKKYKTSLVSKLMEFYDKVEKYKKSSEVAHEVNTRHLTEAIEFSLDENDVGAVLKDMSLKWIDRNLDGEPDEVQNKLIHKTIDSIWK